MAYCSLNSEKFLESAYEWGTFISSSSSLHPNGYPAPTFISKVAIAVQQARPGNDFVEYQQRQLHIQQQHIEAERRQNPQLYRDQQHASISHTFFQQAQEKDIQHVRQLSVHQQREKEIHQQMVAVQREREHEHRLAVRTQREKEMQERRRPRRRGRLAIQYFQQRRAKEHANIFS